MTLDGLIKVWRDRAGHLERAALKLEPDQAEEYMLMMETCRTYRLAADELASVAKEIKRSADYLMSVVEDRIDVNYKGTNGNIFSDIYNELSQFIYGKGALN